MTFTYLTLTPHGGTDIYAACREACRVSDLLTIDVWFSLNGESVLTVPGDDPEQNAANWVDLMREDNRHG